MITKLWQESGGRKSGHCQGDTAVSAVGSAAGGYRSFIPDQCWSSFSDGKADGIQPSFPDKDTVPNLYEHWISRNILTYIRIAMEAGAEDILQVINRPKRYISRDAMPDETVSFEKMKAFYAEKDWIAERIERSGRGSAGHRPDVTSGSRLNYIRQGHGIRRNLIEYAAFRRMRPEELLETADELKESAAVSSL